MITPNSNIVLLGASGSGKGTQAEKLSQDFCLKHLEMGEILRALSRKDSSLGKKILEKVSSGQWVEDEQVNEIIEAKMKKIPKDQGIIFDGFPRTIGQAEFLEKEIRKDGRKKPLVIYLWVRPEKLIYRLLNRKVCDKCNRLFYPPQSLRKSKCDCGGKLVRREDDTEAVIKNRIKEYEEKTEKLISFYRKKGNLYKINGEPSIEEVWDELKRALSKA
jgi:adenylate kinase